MTEAMTGTLYMAVLISRLVALDTPQGSEVSGKKIDPQKIPVPKNEAARMRFLIPATN